MMSKDILEINFQEYTSRNVQNSLISKIVSLKKVFLFVIYLLVFHSGAVVFSDEIKISQSISRSMEGVVNEYTIYCGETTVNFPFTVVSDVDAEVKKLLFEVSGDVKNVGFLSLGGSSDVHYGYTLISDSLVEIDVSNLVLEKGQKITFYAHLIPTCKSEGTYGLELIDIKTTKEVDIIIEDSYSLTINEKLRNSALATNDVFIKNIAALDEEGVIEAEVCFSPTFSFSDAVKNTNVWISLVNKNTFQKTMSFLSWKKSEETSCKKAVFAYGDVGIEYGQKYEIQVIVNENSSTFLREGDMTNNLMESSFVTTSKGFVPAKKSTLRREDIGSFQGTYSQFNLCNDEFTLNSGESTSNPTITAVVTNLTNQTTFEKEFMLPPVWYSGLCQSLVFHRDDIGFGEEGYYGIKIDVHIDGFISPLNEIAPYERMIIVTESSDQLKKSYPDITLEDSFYDEGGVGVNVCNRGGVSIGEREFPINIYEGESGTKSVFTHKQKLQLGKDTCEKVYIKYSVLPDLLTNEANEEYVFGIDLRGQEWIEEYSYENNSLSTTIPIPRSVYYVEPLEKKVCSLGDCKRLKEVVLRLLLIFTPEKDEYFLSIMEGAKDKVSNKDKLAIVEYIIELIKMHRYDTPYS